MYSYQVFTDYRLPWPELVEGCSDFFVHVHGHEHVHGLPPITRLHMSDRVAHSMASKSAMLSTGFRKNPAAFIF